jgi:hypothetical protein
MKIDLLQKAITEIKTDLENAISLARYNDKAYQNGQSAKEALICSQNLILKIHEVVKLSFLDEISKYRTDFTIYPPIGNRSPEQAIIGLIKAKKQDVVIFFDDIPNKLTVIAEGPLRNQYDQIGYEKAERAIIVGVRSQLSSVAKNFDTLMERAFAETLNLRLRMPNIIMGDVYLIPVVEYDDAAMQLNRVAWKKEKIALDKFIDTFHAICNRSSDASNPEIYKYERVALIIVDFRQDPPRIFLTGEELVNSHLVTAEVGARYNDLSPVDFVKDLVQIHQERFGIPGTTTGEFH